VTGARRGEASVAFGSTPSAPLGDVIEIKEVLPAIHFVLDCDLVLGEVLHDYLAIQAAPALGTRQAV
jgi:acetoacetate decarboxylase